MNVDEMQAGIELDRLIAVTVFGTKLGRALVLDALNRSIYPARTPNELESARFYDEANTDGGYPHTLSIPFYSTDITAAWQVVERFRGMQVGLIIKAFPNGMQFKYVAHIPERDCSVNADTAPLAICRAALKVVGNA